MLGDKQGVVLENNVTFRSRGKEARPDERQEGKHSKQWEEWDGRTGGEKHLLSL